MRLMVSVVLIIASLFTTSYQKLSLVMTLIHQKWLILGTPIRKTQFNVATNFSVFLILTYFLDLLLICL